MAEFPCLPLFTDAYLGDTTHLTTTEHGAYLLLLITQWRAKGCVLPDDDKLLARYSKMTSREWAKIRPIMVPFFTISDGVWKQKRLADEKKYVEDKRQQNIEAGRVSALKRKGRHSTDVITDAPTDGQQDGNQPLTPNPTLIPKEEFKKEALKDTHVDLDKTPNASGGAPVPKENFDEAVELYNQMADRAGLAKCQKLSDDRRKKLKSRLKECGGMEGWKTAVEKVGASTFLTGGTDRPFHANFDFLINPTKFTRIMEGAYDNRKSTSPQKQSAHAALATGFDQAVDILNMEDERRGGG